MPIEISEQCGNSQDALLEPECCFFSISGFTPKKQKHDLHADPNSKSRQLQYKVTFDTAGNETNIVK